MRYALLFYLSAYLSILQVNPDGVVYLGDGTWGVEPNIVPLSSEYYIDQVARTQYPPPPPSFSNFIRISNFCRSLTNAAYRFFFSVAVQFDTNITVDAINKNGFIFDTWNRTLQ